MKRDLFFKKPIMNAAGTLGFAPGSSKSNLLQTFGAFITNPISLHARMPAQNPEAIGYAGGVLIHSGLPNPGLAATIKNYRTHWEHASLPIIIHLIADEPDILKEMVGALEEIENVMAVEIGFAPQTTGKSIINTIGTCYSELPIIVSLYPDQVLDIGGHLIKHGVSAISMSSPYGTLISKNKTPITGRLYGQSILPHALKVVHAAAMADIPIIGGGGVWTAQAAIEMQQAGAFAVQMDAALWTIQHDDSKIFA